MRAERTSRDRNSVRITSLIGAVAICALLKGPAAASTLETESIKLVTCRPASTTPCFRIVARLTDDHGNPVALALPEPLAASLKVEGGGEYVTPFHARAHATSSQTHRPRTTLILIDVSGSMNLPIGNGQTRFEAARSAVRAYLPGFGDRQDRLAIVPFESHQVRERIRNAIFVQSAPSADEQIRSLPKPLGRNNTALYAAVEAGLDVLARERQVRPSDDQHLIILTDGENDVRPGDDLDLLRSPTTLETVSARVRAVQGEILAVGFGDRRSLNEAALRQISKRYLIVEDPLQLTQVFASATESVQASAFELTFVSPSFTDLASLAGRTVEFGVTLEFPDHEYAQTSRPVRWRSGDMAANYEGLCDDAERRKVSAQSLWASVLRPAVLFGVFGMVLLALWIWGERLFWGEPVPEEVRAVRGGDAAPASPAKRQENRPPLRGAAEKTNVIRQSRLN